jgi:hypothetical protein
MKLASSLLLKYLPVANRCGGINIKYRSNLKMSVIFTT